MKPCSWAQEAEAEGNYLGLLFFPVASQMPEGTVCALTDQAPRSVCVHKGLIILDLGEDLTMEHLVLSTYTDDRNVRCPFGLDLHNVAMPSSTYRTYIL